MAVETRTDIKGIPRFLFTEGTDAARLHLHISEVGPGQRAHPPHRHEGCEIFYVIEGKGEVLYGGETHPVNTGEAMHLECSILHGIENVGDAPMHYAVIIRK